MSVHSAARHGGAVVNRPYLVRHRDLHALEHPLRAYAPLQGMSTGRILAVIAISPPPARRSVKQMAQLARAQDVRNDSIPTAPASMHPLQSTVDCDCCQWCTDSRISVICIAPVGAVGRSHSHAHLFNHPRRRWHCQKSDSESSTKVASRPCGCRTRTGPPRFPVIVTYAAAAAAIS